jgi:hypothetical protein
MYSVLYSALRVTVLVHSCTRTVVMRGLYIVGLVVKCCVSGMCDVPRLSNQKFKHGLVRDHRSHEKYC